MIVSKLIKYLLKYKSFIMRIRKIINLNNDEANLIHRIFQLGHYF
jgi:hypothetical protein